MMSNESLTETKTLKVGDEAPDFTLPTAQGESFTLSDYRGKKNVVLAFFPFAFSPTCSIQMPGCEAQLGRFDQHDTQVVGISMDGRYALSAWAAQYGMSFPLLSDFYPQGRVTDLYGVRHERGMPERALLVIDKAGKIRSIEVHRPITEVPDNEKVFAVLRELG
jgi:peroxiredoxin